MVRITIIAIDSEQNMLYRATDAAIPQLEPFFYFLPILVDRECFLDVRSYASFSPLISASHSTLHTVSEFFRKR